MACLSYAYRALKEEAWHKEPSHHGLEEISPPPQKPCLDGARNSLARTAAQIRTEHWRSAIYLKRIKRRTDDGCWFCARQRKMTRSHVLLHCQSASLVAARTEAWEDRDPGGVRILLANPRWERRFLELSGVGRRDGHGPGGWTMGSGGGGTEPEGLAGGSHLFLSFLPFRTVVLGGLTPRCAHSAMMKAEDFLCCGLRQEPRPVSFSFLLFFFISVV
jgi:hypothetical protein